MEQIDNWQNEMCLKYRFFYTLGPKSVTAYYKLKTKIFQEIFFQF